MQFTVAESIGVEKRGNYFETSGITRDIVQNHMLQLVSLVGMVFLGSSLLRVSPITRGLLVAMLAATLIVSLENARGGFVARMLSSSSASSGTWVASLPRQ